MSELVVELYDYIAEENPKWTEEQVEKYVLQNIDDAHRAWLANKPCECAVQHADSMTAYKR